MLRKKGFILPLATFGILTVLREWGMRWGSTHRELHQRFPGDEIITQPDIVITNAISIRAPAENIWPWLLQLGYYRGGWFTDSTWRDWDYYPDKLLRFFVKEEAEKSGYAHRETPSAEKIVAEFQDLKAGDKILDGPPGTACFTVAVLEPNQAMILFSNTHLRFLFPKPLRENPVLGIGGEFTWGFILHQIDEYQCRLILRTRSTIQPGWYRFLLRGVVPIANLFLVRKMLTGIKKSAEQAS